jgi:two-component system, cell cycle response regulator
MTGELNFGFLGFPTHEQAALSRILKIAGRSVPAHNVIDDISQSNLVLINGDARQIVRFFLKVRRDQKALIIGDDSHGSGLPLCKRPVRAMELVNVLRMALTAPVPSPNPVTENRGIFTPSVVEDVREMRFEAHSQLQSALQPTQQTEAAVAAISQRAQAAAALYDILVVDDSDVAALALSARLQKLQINVQEARSGEDALAKVGMHRFKLVFLDVMLGDMDGYTVCRAIKRKDYGYGGFAPTVVMLTSRGGTVDKIRGKLAGCDGDLTKPLGNDDFMRILRKHSLTA